MAYQPFNLSGKKVVITGGNGGIGFGMASALVDAGADVCLWGRNPEKNKAAVASLENRGTRIFSQVVDIADKSAVAAAMSEAEEKLGGIDSVFANAGIGTASKSFLTIDEDEYRNVLAINLDGVVYTLQAAANQMKKQNTGGSLVVISSLGAMQGMVGQQHYAASKGAVISVMKSCAVEFARDKIRCNAILPGFVESGMTAYLKQEAYAQKVLPRVPARRWGTPEDFGGIAVYFASDASRYQTGSETIIDGGFSVF